MEKKAFENTVRKGENWKWLGILEEVGYLLTLCKSTKIQTELQMTGFPRVREKSGKNGIL